MYLAVERLFRTEKRWRIISNTVKFSTTTPEGGILLASLATLQLTFEFTKNINILILKHKLRI